jgi:hypothetical protein
MRTWSMLWEATFKCDTAKVKFVDSLQREWRTPRVSLGTGVLENVKHDISAWRRADP